MKKPDVQQRLRLQLQKFTLGEITEQELRSWLRSERDLTKNELLAFVMVRAIKAKKENDLMVGAAKVMREAILQ